jgi:hypothetical protein
MSLNNYITKEIEREKFIVIQVQVGSKPRNHFQRLKHEEVGTKLTIVCVILTNLYLQYEYRKILKYTEQRV